MSNPADRHSIKSRTPWVHEHQGGVRRVHLRKEALKFSSAHMTVFPDGTKEALHGHNYRTDILIGLGDDSWAELISFSVFKEAIAALCAAWDEKVLLARDCPLMEIRSESSIEVEFLLSKKRYVLPADEVVFLPIQNVTAEALAELFCTQLLAQFESEIGGSKNILPLIHELQVTIEETPGQGASFYWKKP